MAQMILSRRRRRVMSVTTHDLSLEITIKVLMKGIERDPKQLAGEARQSKICAGATYDRPLKGRAGDWHFQTWENDSHDGGNNTVAALHMGDLCASRPTKGEPAAKNVQ